MYSAMKIIITHCALVAFNGVNLLVAYCSCTKSRLNRDNIYVVSFIEVVW